MTSLLVSLVSVLVGCVPPYTPPSLSEPHAVANIRVVYHASAGAGLNQSVTIDGNTVQTAQPVMGSDGVATSSTLVRPVDTTWEISSAFFHMEMRQVMETCQTTEYYHCTPGYGTPSSGHGMNSYSANCQRQVSHQRWVMRSVPVTDISCTTGVRQVPRVGGVYLLQYDFYGQGRCTLACFEQIPTGPQTFRLAACGGPPVVTSGGAR